MTVEETGALFDEFVEGGFGPDDADVTIRLARFENWDYKGHIPQPVLALRVDIEDAEGKVFDEHLSCGELRFFIPSSDGRKAIPVGAQQKLNKNTNAVEFLISVMNADTRGELAAKLRLGDVSVLEGAKVHIIRKKQQERPSITATPVADAAATRQRDKMVMTVEKVISYPWETTPVAAGGGKAVAAPAASAAAPAAAPSANDELAAGTLIELLSEAPDNILKVSAVAGKVFSNAGMKAQPAPVRNAVLGLIVKPEFLGAEGRPWTYDKAAGTVKLG